jgi:hypothetical protein
VFTPDVTSFVGSNARGISIEGGGFVPIHGELYGWSSHCPIERHPRMHSQRSPRWSIAPCWRPCRYFWAASLLPGSGEFRAQARFLTRHVWSSSHPVSIRPALFEGLLRWLVY